MFQILALFIKLIIGIVTAMGQFLAGAAMFLVAGGEAIKKDKR